MHTDFWQPALLQALSLSEGPRGADYLAELTGLDQRSVEEILHILQNQGEVIRQPSGGWELAADAAAVDAAREILRERGAPERSCATPRSRVNRTALRAALQRPRSPSGAGYPPPAF